MPPKQGGVSLEAFATRNTPWRSQKHENNAVQKMRLKRIKQKLAKEVPDASYFNQILKSEGASTGAVAETERQQSVKPHMTRKPDPFKRDRETFLREQAEREQEQEAAERKKAQESEERAAAALRRKRARNIITRKTSRGQPALGGQVGLLLERIQKSMPKSA